MKKIYLVVVRAISGNDRVITPKGENYYDTYEEAKEACKSLKDVGDEVEIVPSWDEEEDGNADICYDLTDEFVKELFDEAEGNSIEFVYRDFRCSVEVNLCYDRSIECLVESLTDDSIQQDELEIDPDSLYQEGLTLVFDIEAWSEAICDTLKELLGEFNIN